MNWDEFKTFFVVLIVVCGGITTIGGAINLLLNWKKQSKTTSHDEMLKNHEERIKDLERDKSDDDFIASFEEYEEFDPIEEEIIEISEQEKKLLAYYIDEHIEEFAEILP